MAKTLEFTDTSAQTVKIGDTTTSFTMVLGEDSNPVDLTNATSIIAKLGNSTGYLKSQTVPTSSIADPLSGQIVISFDSDFMSGLPAGSYLLEVWVTYSTGVSIYPSNTMTGFTINSNIESQSGSTITTITFDDFVEAMNKAASTIAKGDKGDKGDTGTVDNAGLTTAPAFVALQTQVNNSAVGTNLLKNTINLSSTSSTAAWDVLFDSSQVYDSGIKFLSGVSAMTFSFNVYIPSNANVGDTIPIQIKGQNSQATNLGSDDYDTIISMSQHAINKNDIGKTIRASCSIQNGYNYQSFDTALADTDSITIRQSSNISGFVYSKPKLEKGSVATDWSPNPSEILTQADYAKIKAAIVALGGSLS